MLFLKGIICHPNIVTPFFSGTDPWFQPTLGDTERLEATEKRKVSEDQAVSPELVLCLLYIRAWSISFWTNTGVNNYDRISKLLYFMKAVLSQEYRCSVFYLYRNIFSYHIFDFKRRHINFCGEERLNSILKSSRKLEPQDVESKIPLWLKTLSSNLIIFASLGFQ